MKFADKYLPPIEDGEYTVHVTQKIETISPDPANPGKSVVGKDSFSASKNFRVISRGFTLTPGDVFSVYPEENARGRFGKELPFLVSQVKTLPWLYGDGKYPWVALIVTGEQDAGVREQDLTVSRLLSEVPEKVFFPAAGMPEKYVEKPDDLCHIVDVPTELFVDIMPRVEETRYLCHARYTDLSNTEEKVSSMDGFFSVVMGNRFVQEGKNTVHLISMLGYPDYGSGEYSKYSCVRMVSLYHWNVFCEQEADGDFRSTVSSLDRKAFSGGLDHVLSQRAVCARKHYLRSGDQTGSLYHSPLVPYKAYEIRQVTQPCHSADSVLIYDKDKAIFDVTYSAAWQLGRMAALSQNAAAKAVTDFRAGVWRNSLKARQESLADTIKPDYGKYCMELSKLWKAPPGGGDKNETAEF